MSASIGWGELASKVIAEEIGPRVLRGAEQQLGEEEGGILGWLRDNVPWLADGVNWVRNLAGRFGGWLIEKAAGLVRGFSLSQVWGWFIGVKNFVWNFNWNASDEELDQMLASQRQALASQFGGAVGCGVGWALGTGSAALLDFGIGSGMDAAMAAMGMPIAVFDKTAMLKAIKAAGLEGVEELSSLFGQFFRSLFAYAARHVVTVIFKNSRKAIKWLASRPALAEFLPGNWEENIAKWGEPGNQPWILSETVEDAVSEIPNPSLRAFVDNFLEEMDECFIEAGYVYAANVQNEWTQRELILGNKHTVEITPDREAPDERIIISGRDQLLRGQITGIVATHQQIANRDIGQLVGRPLNEAMLTQAPTNTLSLEFHWSPRKEPPFTKTRYELDGFDSDKWTEPRFNLPWVAPGRLDWERIKRAAGGDDGFISGPVRCTAFVGWPEQGFAGREVTIFASSQSEGKRRLLDLAELSEGEIYGFKYGERERDPANPQLTYKYDVRVYPKHCFVTSQRREIDKKKGRGSLTGNWSPRRERIELWTSQAPLGASEILQDLRRWHTPLRFG